MSVSLRIDPAELITGALVIGGTGLGVLGADVPGTGTNGPSYLYSSITLPAEAADEFIGLITVPPSAGVFTAAENGVFDLTGAPYGNYTFTFRLFKNGADLGLRTHNIVIGSTAPAYVTATAGNGQAVVSFTAPASTGGAAITGYTVTGTPGGSQSGAASPIVVTGLTNGTAYTFTVHAITALGNGAESAPSNAVTPAAPGSAPGRPAADTSNGGWTPSAGGMLFAMLSEAVPDAATYVYATAAGQLCELALNAIQYPGGPTQQLQFSGSSSTGNGVIVRLKNTGGATVRVIEQALSKIEQRYSVALSASEIAAITSGALSVELEST